MQNGSNDKIKGYHLYAPAQFSISELAPVGGLIGLERGSSRGWRDAGHHEERSEKGRKDIFNLQEFLITLIRLVWRNKYTERTNSFCTGQHNHIQILIFQNLV